MSQKRQSNFELLRIFSMFLIVGSHFAVHGTYESPDYSTIEQIALDILRIGGKLGSNVFVMIGAYFLVGKNFKFERVIRIGVQVWLYSIGILAIAAYFLHLDKNDVYLSIFPFPDAYWFATTYILLLLFIPVLNKLISLVGKNGLEFILSTLFMLWIVLPSLNLATFGLNNFTWFAFLYLAVSYIKLYTDDKLSQIPWGMVGITTLAITILLIVWFHLVSHFIPEKLNDVLIQLRQNGLLTVILSFSLFLFAKESKVFISPVVNYLSGLTFTVYLIHEHPIMRPIIWGVVDNQRFDGFFQMIGGGILSAILVFVITMMISIVTERILHPLMNVITNKGLVMVNYFMDYLKEEI